MSVALSAPEHRGLSLTLAPMQEVPRRHACATAAEAATTTSGSSADRNRALFLALEGILYLSIYLVPGFQENGWLTL